MYHAKQAKVAPAKKKSLCIVCREIESEHKRATGREVHLDHGTLNRLYKGGQRLMDFNASKCWLLSVLKWYWAEEREKWEREKGEKVNKENFLAVYGTAHVRALTRKIISLAFRKTGVWPYDPSVVTTDMMAPSLESSNRG